ncbi:MAG: lipopolysaccharide biosynthesis protein [Planctomycetota bacterium]
MTVLAAGTPTETAGAGDGPVGRVLGLLRRPGLWSAGMSVFDQAVVSGATFATSVLVGRFGGTEALGVYALAWSTLLFVRGIQQHLISSSYTVLCRQRTGRRLALFGGSSVVQFAALAVVVGLASLAVSYGSAFVGRGGTLGPVFAVLAVAGPAILLREFLRAYEFAHFRTPSALVIDVVVAAVQLSGLGLLAYAGRLDGPTALGSLGVACGAAAFVWWLRSADRIKIDRRLLWPHARRSWRFGRWALASQLIGSSALMLAPWVVAAVRDESETGLFAAGSTLVGLANVFVIGVCNYITPKMSEAFVDGGTGRLNQVVGKTVVLYLTTLCGFVVAAVTVGTWAAGAIYGEAFAAAGPVIGILAADMIVNAMSITFGTGLCAMRRPRANFGADVVAISVSLTATVGLTIPFGPTGAAAALLIGGTAEAATRGMIYRKVLREEAARERRAAGGS